MSRVETKARELVTKHAPPGDWDGSEVAIVAVEMARFVLDEIERFRKKYKRTGARQLIATAEVELFAARYGSDRRDQDQSK